MNATCTAFTIDQLHDIKVMANLRAEEIVCRDLRDRRRGSVDLHEMRTGMVMDASELAITAAKQIKQYYER